MTHFLEPLAGRHAEPHALVIERTGTTLANTLEAAFDSRRRRQGLLGRTTLPPGTALVIAPCSAIHTCFMKFAIDVVFATRDGVVMRVCRNVRPWRIAGVLGAFVAIEMLEGGAGDVLTGDRLTCTATRTRVAPEGD